jgi:HK97 family phage portal protein|nr:MAG TPA: portal protein [Caudoviricetes sp.]
MKIRSMLENIFGNKKPKYKYINTYKMLNDSSSAFYNWNGKIYDSSVARTAIGTNGINAGKLNPKHIRKHEQTIEISPNNNIKNLLIYPNPFMTMFDFLQKMMIQREENNNAFAYIDRDKNVPGMNGILGIYPLNCSSVELYEDEENNLYIEFRFRNGQTKFASYNDVIHIRKHFNENDFWGANNSKVLSQTFEVINTTSQGIRNAIKNTSFLRGILEFKNVLQPDDVEKNVKDFSERYLSINNKDGIAYTDPRYSFHETKQDPYIPNKAQMDYSKQELYEYFNTNEKIIKGNYTEEEWIAYFETTIEPFSIQMSQEMTRKIFTPTELTYGNEIILEANRLANASNDTKITICKDLGHLFTINEQREIWNRGPVPDGDRRLQSLNYVNADKADEYQLNKEE